MICDFYWFLVFVWLIGLHWKEELTALEDIFIDWKLQVPRILTITQPWKLTIDPPVHRYPNRKSQLVNWALNFLNPSPSSWFVSWDLSSALVFISLYIIPVCVSVPVSGEEYLCSSLCGRVSSLTPSAAITDDNIPPPSIGPWSVKIEHVKLGRLCVLTQDSTGFW